MKRGFTLVELSIVLVIIGLLTGGVLAGQALIRSSKIHSLTKTFEQYEIAIVTFKNIYGAYPGDTGTNGTSSGWDDYWTWVCGITNPDTPSGTGYGNFLVGTNSGNCWPEMLYAFSNLSDADMIPDKFTATPIPPLSASAQGWRGVKIPALPDNGALNLLSTTFGWPISREPTLSHCKVFLRAGTYYESPWDATNYWSNAYLPASMMQGLDNKIDDGRPASGRLLAQRPEQGAGALCNSNVAGSGFLSNGPFDGTSTYNLSIKEKACVPFYCITDPTP